MSSLRRQKLKPKPGLKFSKSTEKIFLNNLILLHPMWENMKHPLCNVKNHEALYSAEARKFQLLGAILDRAQLARQLRLLSTDHLQEMRAYRVSGPGSRV